MLSNKKIEEIEKRLENLSPYPWYFKPDGTYSGANFIIGDKNGEMIFDTPCFATNNKYSDENWERDDNWFLNPENWNYEEGGKEAYYNSIFVVNAKKDIEELLKEVKRLKKQLNETKRLP